MDREFLTEAAVFAGIVIVFDSLERLRPRQRISKRQEFFLNFCSLLIVIIGGEAWKALLLEGLHAFRIAPIQAGLFPGLQSTGKILIAIVVTDFCLYWVHRAMHRKRLWRTHIFHHTISQLWWLSGSRTSVTHLLLFAIPQILVGYWLLAFTPPEAAIAFSFGVFVNIWIHTNLDVRLGPLEAFVITPNYHRIHHGAKGLSNHNLGFVFTIWDRMFGTYVDPVSINKDFALGFASPRGRLLKMIAGL